MTTFPYQTRKDGITPRYFRSALANKRVIALVGHKGAGKSVVAKHIADKHGYTSIGVFDVARRFLAQHFGEDFRDFDEAPRKDRHIPGRTDLGTRRHTMIQFGEFIATTFGQGTVSAMMLMDILSQPNDKIVVHGLRLPAEANYLRGYTDCTVVRITRSDKATDVDANDWTENGVSKIEHNFFLDNSADVATMVNRVDEIIAGLEKIQDSNEAYRAKQE